jgi:hypothetical protein
MTAYSLHFAVAESYSIFWGLPNIQDRDHITKSADEAAYRKFTRSPSLEFGD